MRCANRVAETATVLVVIAASAPFAFALIIEQVPQKLAAAHGDAHRKLGAAAADP